MQDSFDTSNRDIVSDPIFDDLLRMSREHLDTSPEEIVRARAPGRVNLIGDHTDYNDGFVLPAPIDRAVYAAFRRRNDPTVRLHSVNFEETVEYALPDPSFSELPGWVRYVAGVAQELGEKAPFETGFEGVIYGNVPLGSGLSSSAALEVASAEGLKTLFQIDLSPIETARLCQRVEHTYVGVQCGIMDQMAARLGRAGHALSLDCRSLDYEHIPLPLDETSLVIADSRVSRELASSKYNERRAECEEGVAFFQQYDDIKALRDVSFQLFDRHAAQLSETIRRRCRHVLTENRRVTKSVQHLKNGDLDAVGTLMNASHQSLREDYDASIPELNVLVETAQETEGVFGARMTGAGFGGCIVSLVADAAVSRLQNRLTTHYHKAFDREPDLFVVQENLEAMTLPPS